MIKKKILLPKLLALFFLINISNSYSQNTSMFLDSDEIILTIKPNICVAPRGQESCISTINISWESIRKGNYCLNSDLSIQSLKCWKSINRGFYQHKLTFKQNIIYMMSDKISNIKLVTAIMKFKSLKPHRKYKKRHSRFPWSLNAL